MNWKSNMSRIRKQTINALGAVCLALVACRQAVPEKGNTPDSDSVIQKSGRADTLLKRKKKVINVDPGTCVFVLPSHTHLDKMREQSASAEEFDSMVEEGVFYVSKAKEYLEMIHAASIDVTSDDSLDFVTENGKHYSISIEGMSWDLILYNGEDAPFRSDITTPEEECKKLYQKK